MLQGRSWVGLLKSLRFVVTPRPFPSGDDVSLLAAAHNTGFKGAPRWAP